MRRVPRVPFLAFLLIAFATLVSCVERGYWEKPQGVIGLNQEDDGRYFINGPFAGIGGQGGSTKWYVYVDDDHRPYFIMPGTEEAQYDDPRAYDWETARHAGDNVVNAFVKTNRAAHGIKTDEPAIDSGKNKKKGSGWFGGK